MFTRPTDFKLPQSDKTHGNPHQLLRHIEFPYYNEETPSRDKIIEELDYYIEALCKADSYINQESTKRFETQDSEQQYTDLDITIIDWESFDMSKYDVQQTEPPTAEIYTSGSPAQTPIHISISSLWHILRLQHICGSKENMIAILKSAERDCYQIMEDDSTLIVSKSFNWDTDSDSVKSFSSREDW